MAAASLLSVAAPLGEGLALLVLLLGSVSALQRRTDRASLDSLLDAMTLEEKVTLLHGTRDPSGRAEVGYVAGVPRVGVPPLRITDGRSSAPSDDEHTVVPAPIALGATFSPDLARRVGGLRGREGRARGQTVLLRPTANVLRVPEARNRFESLGEDPCLIGDLVAEEVKGIQDEGMIATVRHFVAHTFEANRDRVSVELSERALREIYVPGLRRALEAGVGSVMGAPNRVHGTYACDHEWLLTDLLKDEFGFEGWVMSSWHARHTLGALRAGLDQELPGRPDASAPQAVYFDGPLRRGVEMGRVSEETVDASVRRILRQMKRAGHLDEAPSSRPSPDPVRGAAVAREAALSGAVLLRNENEALPLSDDVSSLLVVGPAAQQLPSPPHARSDRSLSAAESPLEALRRRLAESVSVQYVPGVDSDGTSVPASVLSPSPSLTTNGLRRSSAEGIEAIDPGVDFTGPDALPAGSTWTWTGTLTPPETGPYALRIQTVGGRGRLEVDGELRAATGGVRSNVEALSPSIGGTGAAAVVELEAGTPVSVRITADGSRASARAAETPLEVRWTWVPPSRRWSLRRRAHAAARTADAAVVFAADQAPLSADSASLSLPASQEALVEAVAAESPATTVVLNTGGPTTMPWLDEVDAVLQMWYPGQAGGDATAALLTGEAEPAGRLPVTFPRRPADSPVQSPDRYPGVNGRVYYDEDIFVGYRWYDREGIEPLFPFGHGLSYTQFAYSALSIHERGDGGDVRFRVENIGERPGATVPQVYVGPPADPPVPMAPKALVGFEKVELAPGEATSVTASLDPKALSYWSVEDEEWRMPSGLRPVYVGPSSREIALEGNLFVEERPVE
jgi:beta-glucosidase